ncbi:MAG: hypothetical protein KJO26_10410 [Deltaproteobacteria bacterium]|nr:hypothetical protein [Deltaproteobacteria bacterium]
MKELDAAIKTVVEGLRSIAKNVEKIAEKLERNAPKKKQTKVKPIRSTKAKPAQTAKAVAKPKKAPAKKAPVKKTTKKTTAANTVLAIINRSKKGVDSTTLAKKTGYDNKKIANIVFKLRKQGKIKSFIRGVYTKA